MTTGMFTGFAAVGLTGDPAPGDLAQIGATRDSLRTVANGSRLVVAALSGLRSPQFDQGWEGDSANAFIEEFADLRKLLEQLAQMHDRAFAVLDEYTWRLAALQREVGDALARARARWNDRHHAEDELGRQRALRNSIHAQINQLRGQIGCTADPLARQHLQLSLQDAQHRDATACRAEDIARTNIGRSQRALDAETACLRDIGRRFHDLDEATAAKVRGLIPDALKDDSWFERYLRECKGALGDFFGGVGMVVHGLVRDGLARILQGMRTLLNKVSDLLLIAGLFLLALAALTKFPHLAAAGGILLQASFWASAIAGGMVIAIFVLQQLGSTSTERITSGDLVFALLAMIPVLGIAHHVAGPVARGVRSGRPLLEKVSTTLTRSPTAVRTVERFATWTERTLENFHGTKPSKVSEAIEDLAEGGLEHGFKGRIDQAINLDDITHNLKRWLIHPVLVPQRSVVVPIIVPVLPPVIVPFRHLIEVIP